MVIALLVILHKNMRYVNCRKLAKALGISTRKAAFLLKQLEALGILERMNDRRGRFKVFKLKA